MILILSESSDKTTNEVIDWITFFNKDFIRINDSDACYIESIVLNNSYSDIIFKLNDKTIRFSNIVSYWYRRGNFSFDIPKIKFNNILHEKEIKSNLWQEIRSLYFYFHSVLKSKNGLGSFFDNNINKLENLELAKQCGLLIPETLITSELERVIDFVGKENEVITKAISETIMFSVAGEGTVQSYTNIVKLSDVEMYENHLFPSLFQKSVNKKYELRIFYLDGCFYPMAIFSQSNIKTKTDFRNYDEMKPNRCVPYILPSDIQHKLDCFMRKKEYKTGSIDMLVDHSNNFVFLEVNPVGQFGMTSYPCNYYLEKKVAEFLCGNNE